MKNHTFSVSVGGTTGLFVGASILSFVELIFYFTVRFASNLRMDRQKRKKNATGTIVYEHLEPKVEIVRIGGLEGSEGIQEGPYSNSGVKNLNLFNHIT